MKIAYITPEYPHPKIKQAAGIGTSIKNLCTALVLKNIQVTVFVYHQNTDEVFMDEGVEIHSVKSKRYKFATWFFYRKHIQNYVNRIVLHKNIQLLEAPDWTGITAFMRFKIPLVIRLHGSDAYFCKLEARRQKFKNFLFEKTALRKANAFIAPTFYAGNQTQKIFRLNKDKIKIIHYGLQLENFQNENPSDYNRNTLLYFGTIIRKKGVLKLAEIFNEVVKVNPEAKLLLIGSDAPDLQTKAISTYELMEQIFSDSAKKQVKYLGKISYKEVKHYIKKAHICVFPSFAETLGMVTIESMAMQKPVINTSIGWGQELIEHGVDGYLVHPIKIHDFATYILMLLNNEILCKQIGEAAKLKVELLFNIDKNVDINIKYYKSIIV